MEWSINTPHCLREMDHDPATIVTRLAAYRSGSVRTCLTEGRRRGVKGRIEGRAGTMGADASIFRSTQGTSLPRPGLFRRTAGSSPSNTTSSSSACSGWHHPMTSQHHHSPPAGAEAEGMVGFAGGPMPLVQLPARLPRGPASSASLESARKMCEILGPGGVAG